MKVSFRLDRNELLVVTGGDVTRIEASCIVRNEINGWRKPHQVVHAISENNVETDFPVQPRKFPKGQWKITAVEPRDNIYTKPFVIMTDAWQLLDRWKLDDDGFYEHNTHLKWPDYQYFLHYSPYKTTLGCIRIHQINDLYWLANKVKSELLQLKNKGKEPFIDLIVC
jgi:hypothetical protein